MAAIHRPTRAVDAPRAPYVPPISDEELRRRNLAAAAFLESLTAEGDEQDQRETMALLREELGKNRTLSSRPVFR